jgi:hypothetical protein
VDASGSAPININFEQMDSMLSPYSVMQTIYILHFKRLEWTEIALFVTGLHLRMHCAGGDQYIVI